MYKVIISLYFCFSLFVFAESINQGNESIRIQNLVTQVKSAPPSDKRVLMNQLKVMLRHTNQVHRMQVMKELKQSFSNSPTIHKGQQKRKHNFNHPQNGKHQPKHRKYRYRKGRDHQNGGNRR